MALLLRFLCKHPVVGASYTPNADYEQERPVFITDSLSGDVTGMRCVVVCGDGFEW